MAVAILTGVALHSSASTPAGVVSPTPPPLVSVASTSPTSQGTAPPPGLAFAGSAVVDGSRSVLRRPMVQTVRNWAAGDDCAALADAGFTARCGTAGALVWVVQSRPLDRGPGFEDVRTTVADVAGSDSRNIVFAFYRLGLGDVLSVDMVESPGVVGVHRDYPYGSARATAGRLDGWATTGGYPTDTSNLVHDVIARGQPLSDDGRSLRATPTALLIQDQEWERPLVEGPAMIRDGDRYYFFYVAGPWQTADYASGTRRVRHRPAPAARNPTPGCSSPRARWLVPAARRSSTTATVGAGWPFTAGARQRWAMRPGRRMLYLLPLHFEGGAARARLGGADTLTPVAATSRQKLCTVWMPRRPSRRRAAGRP